MSLVRVAIPVVKGKRKFFLAKGRPWSLVEHVFLAALAASPRTVGELSQAADMPRRLVLEALIRLMRAGWVDLLQDPKGVQFRISAAGQAVVNDEELPQVSKTMSRWMNFVIDKLTGTLYRSRELPFFEKHVVQLRAERERLVWLAPRDIEPSDDTAGVLSTLFEVDERFMGVEAAGERMVDRWAIATVRNGTVEGLSPRAPRELVELVQKAAFNAPQHPEGSHSPSFDPGVRPATIDRDLPEPITASFKHSDLILGGAAHKNLLQETIKRARQRIIIHSTFISEAAFSAVHPLLHDAIKRGAIVDILWGEDDDKTDVAGTVQSVNKICERIQQDGLQSSFRVHRFSTRSHAKILCADDGREGRMMAVVGSCNWLSSNFQSYEASARFSDGGVVAAVFEQIADLTKGADRHWTELTSEMAQLADKARFQRPITGGIRAKVTIVLGPQHAQFVRMARDRATKRIFVTSHRLGAATRAAIVVPASAAARERGLDVQIYYGTQSGHVSTSMTAKLTSSAGSDGVTLQAMIEPRLHAKILAWDDDNVLITSQNWLSADPGEASFRREIGVLIQCSGVARQTLEDFEASRRI
jgi:phosphatidylserine/phosphatidylglycerophosphate/cardiolipin synthase-like enzyme/DNA-binding transcriptional ArsR family regulator